MSYVDVGDNKSYIDVGDNKSYVGLTFSYKGVSNRITMRRKNNLMLVIFHSIKYIYSIDYYLFIYLFK